MENTRHVIDVADGIAVMAAATSQSTTNTIRKQRLWKQRKTVFPWWKSQLSWWHWDLFFQCLSDLHEKGNSQCMNVKTVEQSRT
jgi:hypothetical protein